MKAGYACIQILTSRN